MGEIFDKCAIAEYHILSIADNLITVNVSVSYRIVDMSSFPGMHDMSYLHPPLIFVLFLNIQHVQNGFVFVVF